MKKNLYSYDKENILHQHSKNIGKLNWIQRYIAGDKLNNLQNQLEEKEIQILDTEQLQKRLVTELEDEKVKNQEVINKLKNYTDLIDRLHQEREHIVALIDNLKKEIELSKGKIQEYKDDKKSLLTINSNLEKNIDNLNEKIKNIESYNKEIRISNEEKQTEIDRLSSVNQKLQVDLHQESEKYSYQMSQIQARWSEKETNQKAERDELQQALTHLEDRLEEEKQVKEEYSEKANSIIDELHQAQEDLKNQLKHTQEYCHKIENEKLEAEHRADRQKEEIDFIQSRLDQDEYELKQQTEQFDFKLDKYRMSLNHFQLASSIALHQVMGEFAAALIRSVYMSHAQDLLADYINTNDEIDTIRACGLWFMEIQLCADFNLYHEDGILSCDWHHRYISTAHPTLDATMINELVIGVLWALLSIKTERKWNCHREFHDDAKSMKVMFRSIDNSNK
jgi:chromosome segregation ATPase